MKKRAGLCQVFNVNFSNVDKLDLQPIWLVIYGSEVCIKHEIMIMI